jgi:uncharacterized OB-fold protein
MSDHTAAGKREDLLPPQRRTAHSAPLQHAKAGALTLQVCAQCGAVQYPPRELCGNCLSDTLEWQAVDQRGTVVACTVLQHSLEPYFSTRTPWPLASVQLDCGPIVYAALRARDNQPGRRVQVGVAHDPGGQWILIAADTDTDLLDAHQRAALLAAIGYGDSHND